MSETKGNHRDQIDRYVNEKMEAKERQEFEQRMREHAELARSVHEHRDVLRGIEYHYMKELKELLILSDQPKKLGIPLWAIILISVLGLGILAGLAFYFNIF